MNKYKKKSACAAVIYSRDTYQRWFQIFCHLECGFHLFISFPVSNILFGLEYWIVMVFGMIGYLLYVVVNFLV